MIKKIFWRSLSVLVLSSLVSMLGVLVDGIIIGQFLDDTALAAYGLATPVTVLVIGVGCVISSGASSLCSSSLGRGDTEEASGVFSSACLSCVFIGLGLGVASFVFIEPLAAFLGAPAENLPLASATEDFVLGYLAAIPAILLTQLLSSLMYLENARNLAFIAAVVGTAINIFGDILNVSLLSGGLLGIALATSVSYFAMLMVLLSHFLRREHLLKPKLSSASWQGFLNLWRLGLPSADIQVCSMIRSVVLNHLLFALASAPAVAAFSIRMSMYNLYGAFTLGFGMVALILVSFYSGDEHVEAMHQVLRMSLKYGFFAMAVLAVLVSVAADWLVSFYTSDENVAAMAAMSVRLFAASLPIFVINSVLAKHYQALKLSTISHAVTILENLVYICPIAYLFSGILSVDGVWLSFLAAEVLTLLTVFFIAFRKLKRMPVSLKDLMLLPEGFGASAESRLFMDCRTKEDASLASERAAAFFKSKGADGKTANRLSICIEELLLNFVLHGKRKGDSADVVIGASENEWTICLRDSSSPFDPRRWLELHEKDSPGEETGLGLKLVFQAAHTLSYTHVLDMNQIKIAIPKSRKEE